MPQKKVLILNASPRKNGLTNSLLLNFKKKIDELIQNSDSKIISELIQLSDYNILHCTGCDACLKSPNICPLNEKDDMNKIEEKFIESDAIIVGSPSYFANVPGIMKDLIDRSRPMKMAKYKLQNKYFSVIAASGLRDGGNNFVANTLIHWALIQGMIVIAALGHPVIMNNFPSESLQMINLKEFRQKDQPSELSVTLVNNLAERIFDLLKQKNN